jgi:peptidoglycan/LPS O-acetylase OafA/YrhL
LKSLRAWSGLSSAGERSSATARSLAGLMALSVVAIFAHHAAQPQNFPGDLGVITFLLAAGYGMSVALLKVRPASRRSLRSFWSAHLAATYPLFVILAVVFVFGAATLSRSLARYAGQALASLTFTVNLFASSHVDMGPFLHLWPFAMEEQWFLLLALVGLYLARHPVADRTLVNLLLGVAVLSSLDQIVSHSLFRPDSQVAPLALATAVALSRRSGLEGWRSFRPSAGVAGLAGVGILLVLLWGSVDASLAASLRPPAVTWLGLLLLAFVTRPDAAGALIAFLGSRALATMGGFAVAFYLWHYPMLHLIGSRPDRAVGIVLALLASLAASVASQLLLDFAFAGWARSRSSARRVVVTEPK